MDGGADQIALENPRQRHPNTARRRPAFAMQREPHRTFSDVRANPDDEHRRNRPHPEHGSPGLGHLVAQQRIEGLEHERRKGRIPTPTRPEGSRLLRPEADRAGARAPAAYRLPIPPHPDAKQRAEGEQGGVGRRKPAEHGEDREPDDGEDERQLAAPAIGGRARGGASDESKHQRDRAQCSGQGVVDGEAALNIGEHKCEDGEIEAVEHPSEKRSRKRPLLR